ncbi:MAG: hypothetical protein R2843_11050 [Thermomicrobiales bacterium]
MRAAEKAFLTSVVVNYAASVRVAVPTRARSRNGRWGFRPRNRPRVALWEVGLDVLVLALLSLVWALISGGKGARCARFHPQPAPDRRQCCWLRSPAASCSSGGTPPEAGALGAASHRGAAVHSHADRTTASVCRRRVVSLVYWGMQVAVLWLLLEAVGVDASLSFTLRTHQRPDHRSA